MTNLLFGWQEEEQEDGRIKVVGIAYGGAPEETSFVGRVEALEFLKSNTFALLGLIEIELAVERELMKDDIKTVQRDANKKLRAKLQFFMDKLDHKIDPNSFLDTEDDSDNDK